MIDLVPILLRHRYCHHWNGKRCVIIDRDGCACREACEAIRRAVLREGRQLQMQLEAAE